MQQYCFYLVYKTKALVGLIELNDYYYSNVVRLIGFNMNRGMIIYNERILFM